MITRLLKRLLPAGLFLTVLSPIASGVDDQPLERVTMRSASLSTLFPAEQVEALGSTLSPEQEVQWRIYVPDKPEPAGVLVFISPSSSGMPQQDWVGVLEQKNLIWVAAENFGNTVPTAQRLLAAIMGLTDVRQNFELDNKRIYVAGLSGGGRAASTLITRFPQMFTGAIYMVGVDFWEPEQEHLLEHITRNRYVFLTGHKDFNRGEIKTVYKKYQTAGVEQALLMDLPDFGHEYPNAQRLAEALNYLDTGAAE